MLLAASAKAFSNNYRVKLDSGQAAMRRLYTSPDLERQRGLI